MGFVIHFYIIFGTNLLSEGPTQIVVFLPISVFRRKRISNGVQTEWNLRESYFWNKHDPEDLGWTSSNQQGGHEAGWRLPPGRALHPRGPLVALLTDLLCLYILIYPGNIRYGAKTLFPPPQPSVPVRSHLGAFSGILPEGALITEGFYINTVASPMMCE